MHPHTAYLIGSRIKKTEEVLLQVVLLQQFIFLLLACAMDNTSSDRVRGPYERSTVNG